MAGALPLLYGMAEGIVTGATYDPAKVEPRGPALPAAGKRRSRFHDAIGYLPDGPMGHAHAPLAEQAESA